MAGVSLAWLLDGEHDVVLLEAGESVGGNIRSVPVELDGYKFEVDLGAQYFHPGPYPTYVKLLELLGLYPSPEETHAFPSSITLSSPSNKDVLFVSPVFPDRIWPILAPWNHSGLEAFNTVFRAAKQREEEDGSWALTLEDWLPTLGLSQEQWEGMVLPWAASLFSGDVKETRGLSARAAMIFVAKALPDNLTEPLLYYVLKKGLTEPLSRMMAQVSTVKFLTRTCVTRTSPHPGGGFLIEFPGGAELVDQIVLACSGPPAFGLLEGIPGASEQQQALGGIGFQDAHLALHTNPIYVPSNAMVRSFFNAEISNAESSDDSCEASMWMSDVLTQVPQGTAAKLYKTWVTHRHKPGGLLAEARFRHMLPTPDTLKAQVQLSSLQGHGGVWFAGGYLHHYDSQETALRSALGVAKGLGCSSERLQSLS